jgi:hypothetical protein
MAGLSAGFVASLLRAVYTAAEGLLSFFLPLKLEVTDYACGRLEDREVDWDHYVLRVGLKFINSSQKTVVVTMIRAFLENKELEYLGTTAGKGNILTSKGWRILDQPRQELFPFPCWFRPGMLKKTNSSCFECLTSLNVVRPAK